MDHDKESMENPYSSINKSMQYPSLMFTVSDLKYLVGGQPSKVMKNVNVRMSGGEHMT